jgi:hypothetical protein
VAIIIPSEANMDDEKEFSALRYLLTVDGRLYPEEFKELSLLLNRYDTLVQVEADAQALIDIMAAAEDPPPCQAKKRCLCGCEDIRFVHRLVDD